MKPSIGRIVHVYNRRKDVDTDDPEPGIITKVWNANCVNVTVFTDADDQDVVSLYRVQFENVVDGELHVLHATWPKKLSDDA